MKTTWPGVCPGRLNHITIFKPLVRLKNLGGRKIHLTGRFRQPVNPELVANMRADNRYIPRLGHLRQIEADTMARVLAVNAIGPALVLRHFLPLMRKDGKAVMAHLSARVGSISDNRLGGWYSYRAAKAAQNMIVKNAAIEVARRHRDLLIVGLHPGTVDTKLSAPFQANVAAGKLFSGQSSAG